MRQILYAPEMNLSDDFRRADGVKGEVHSIFSSVINLLFMIEGERRRITLIRQKIPLLPECIRVPDAIFSMLEIQLKYGIIKLMDGVCIGDILLMLNFSINVKLYLPEKVDGSSEEVLVSNIRRINALEYSMNKKADMESLPFRFGRSAGNLVKGYLAEAQDNIIEAYQELVGAGHGLTPSCDDAMLGIMAGACTWFTIMDSVSGRDKFLKLSRQMLQDLIQQRQTTEISCKYLKCACRGNFSVSLCELMEWLACAGWEDSLPKKQILSIADTGHTSGVDTLYGLKIFLKEVIGCIG